MSRHRVRKTPKRSSLLLENRQRSLVGVCLAGRMTMRKLLLIGATVIGAALLSISPISVNWSANNSVSVSQDRAFAEVGRPLTPGSVAGVNRRHDRRAVRRCGAGVTCPHY